MQPPGQDNRAGTLEKHLGASDRPGFQIFQLEHLVSGIRRRFAGIASGAAAMLLKGCGLCVPASTHNCQSWSAWVAEWTWKLIENVS